MSNAGSGSIVRTHITPSTGRGGSTSTSPASIAAVASPHANGSSGNAPRRESGSDAHRRLHHRRDDRGNPGSLGDRECSAHTAQGLLLEDDHVGRVDLVQPTGVCDRAHAFVGRDGYVDRSPYPCEIVERRDRLLHELEVVARQSSDRVDRGVDVPCAVGIDPQRRTRSDRIAHRRDHFDVGRRTDLDLHRRESAERGGIEARAVDQRVHGHELPLRGRETFDRGFLCSPTTDDRVGRISGQGRALAPTSRTLEQRDDAPPIRSRCSVRTGTARRSPTRRR